MGKYDGLRVHLRRRPGPLWSATFDEVAELVPGGLPPSAYDHTAWWANTSSHSEAVAWLSAGWRTDAVELLGRRVTFVRS